MKKVLLLLYIALTFSGFSQINFRFADSTAQWNVFTNQNPMWCHCISYYTTVYNVVKDTVVANKNGQKISDGSVIWQDSTGKVFRIPPHDTIQLLIYDFSKNQSDTFITNSSGTIGVDVHCSVDSVDTIMLGGRLRKRMVITYNNVQGYKDIWIYGIGSTASHFLNPGLDRTWIDGDNYSLLCFIEQDSLLYHDATSFSTCIADTLYYLSIAEKSKSGAYYLSPNPATTYLTIQLQQNLSSSTAFQLFDITGRMILQKPLTAPTTRIELSGVSKGMYLYSVVSEQQRVGAGKVIIE